ncbi:MAG: thiamine pyrophosphate-binding protein [Theionarchaea archaeon]|nr:thiamine pyrophosphate-binding protein [Theionarchaea archaeon]MBU7036484.1 thiamine pyrophosphate-binding protein [Theionarchaea archaeon]
MKGAALLVESLIEHEVRYIFGLPGDTSLDLYEALYDAEDEICHVLATDERNAAYMADAYARITNRPGVCEGPSGGGASYIIPGLYEAHYSSLPMVAINTDIPVAGKGKAVLTEMDQVHFFEDATKWSTVVTQAEKIPETVRNAFREATTGKPGAVHISFPMDVLGCEGSAERKAFRRLYTSLPAVRICPSTDDVSEALNIIMESETPFVVAGGGIHLSQAYEALEEFAVITGSLVGTSITGKGSMDEEHPLSAGVVGENGGSPAANVMLNEADLVIFVGTQTGSVVTSHWHTPPNDGRRKIIQIDIDPQEIGRNYDVSCGLVGDARSVLEILVRGLETKMRKDAGRSERLNETITAWKEAELADPSVSRSIHPLTVVKTCKKLLPEDVILVADAGTPTPYFASFYPSRARRMFLSPRAFGSLGYAIPGAVGAHKGRPSSRIISLTGDGSMLVSMAELASVAREQIPAVVILFHNNEYGWIKVHLKYRKEQKYLSVDLPEVKYDGVAESLGLSSSVAETDREFEEALKMALKTDEPTFIDAHTMRLHEIAPEKLPWVVH